MENRTESFHLFAAVRHCLLQTAFITFFLASSLAAQIDLPERDRDRWQQPERVMDAAGLGPGMVIGEAGAGTGYFTFKLARRVGPGGLVYANDIRPQRLQEVRQRCLRENVTNIHTVLGSEDDPRFPSATLDMVFMVYVLHDLKKPIPFLKNLIPALKPGGTLVIVDQDPEKTGSGTGHFWRREKVLQTLAAAGFALLRLETFLARDNIYIFRPPAGSAGNTQSHPMPASHINLLSRV